MERVGKENKDERYYPNSGRRDLNYVIQHTIKEVNSLGIFDYIKRNPIYYFLSSIFEGLKSPYKLSDLKMRIESFHPNQINSLIRVTKIRKKIENNAYRSSNNFLVIILF